MPPSGKFFWPSPQPAKTSMLQKSTLSITNKFSPSIVYAIQHLPLAFILSFQLNILFKIVPSTSPRDANEARDIPCCTRLDRTETHDRMCAMDERFDRSEEH